MNRCVKRPIHPTDKSNELLRQIKPTSEFFCTIDSVSGYYQVAVGDASTDLLVIATPLRKVQDEGASDIFNIVTADGRTT